MYHDPKWMRNEGQDKKKRNEAEKGVANRGNKEREQKEELRSREEIG